MAKYQVELSCGHTQQIELFGKNEERERKIEYLKNNGKCSECYKEELKKIQELKVAEKGLKATEISYREYKLNYSQCETVKNSYDANKKTIIVYI